jgi:hypothetical protein
MAEHETSNGAARPPVHHARQERRLCYPELGPVKPLKPRPRRERQKEKQGYLAALYPEWTDQVRIDRDDLPELEEPKSGEAQP